MRTAAALCLTLLVASPGNPAAQATQPAAQAPPQPGQIVPPTLPRAPAQPAQPPTTPRLPPPQTGSSIVRGQLLDALTGSPIRRGRVSTTGPRNPDLAATTTDGEGRFELRELPAGKYVLNASRSGYLSLQLSNGGKPLPPLAVGDGEVIDKVVLRLIRGGVITGQVFDDLGEPQPGISMSVLRQQYVDGRRQMNPVYQAGMNSIATDDLGVYRIYGLDPGEYYVSARPRTDYFFGAQAVNGEGPAQTYYPGTANVAEARRVTVRAGRETQGVSFATVVTRLARIRGRALTSIGEPFLNGSISITQREGNGTTSNGVGIRPDATFEVNNLPPGRYLLSTRNNNTRDDDPGEVGRLLVSVNGEDLDNVLLVATTGGTARGRVVTDEGIPLPFMPSALILSFFPVDPTLPYMGRPQPPVRDDWTFEIKGLFDRMQVRSNMPSIPSPGSAWMIKAIMLNGLDVTDSGIEFKPGQTVDDIEVVYSRKLSYFRGTVQTDQLPVSNTWVIVFPADESKWVPQSRWIRSSTAGGKGQFSMPVIPSDDYLTVAVTGLEQGQWQDPEFLKSVRDLATRLSISEGETKVQDMKIVEWRK